MKISNSLVKENLAEDQSKEYKKFKNEDRNQSLRVRLKRKNSKGGEILIFYIHVSRANLYWGSIMCKPMLLLSGLLNSGILEMLTEGNHTRTLIMWNKIPDLLLCENLSKRDSIGVDI